MALKTPLFVKLHHQQGELLITHDAFYYTKVYLAVCVCVALTSDCNNAIALFDNAQLELHAFDSAPPTIRIFTLR